MSIRFFDIALIAGVALGLCVLAAVYPATRAAGIEPAEAINTEG